MDKCKFQTKTCILINQHSQDTELKFKEDYFEMSSTRYTDRNIIQIKKNLIDQFEVIEERI